MRSVLITQERLREVLKYEPSSGEWTWLKRTAHCVVVGSVVSSVDDKGYIRFNVDRQTYRAHRLAWFYMTGSWPENEVDHINGVRTDNRWENLRAATRTINMHNQKRAHKGSLTGVLGVSIDRGRIFAQITVGGKPKKLGYFKSTDEAHAAYLEAKRRLHEGCTI